MITKGQLRLFEIVQRDTGVEFKVKKFTNKEASVVLESIRHKIYRTVCLSVTKLIVEINLEKGIWFIQSLKKDLPNVKEPCKHQRHRSSPIVWGKKTCSDCGEEITE